jgi:LPS export ABC transporter protein LptC
LKTLFKIPDFLFKYGAILFIASFLISCEKKMGVIKNDEILLLPTTTVKNFETVYSDSSKLQLILSSPLMESYSRDKPSYAEFKKGLKVLFYDGHKEPIASFTSKYAKYLDNIKLWEVNEKNERLETELLYWDQNKDQVYTDRFVRITSKDDVVMGIGMKSNSRFTNWWIINSSAKISM